MIFNIQRYSTHDGPGIRTVIFLKGCSLGCLWCQNPESRSHTPDLLFDQRLCLKNCQLCCNAMPDIFSRKADKLTINRTAIKTADYAELATVCPSLALTVYGETQTVDKIMQQINKDAAFYTRTGGGITLSGGEPFMQPELSQQILQQCKQQNYHTAVETCLHTPWKNIEPCLPYLDLFLADLKHIDDKVFKQWTNGSAKRVLDNFRKLSATDTKIVIRVPLIQGFNADRQSIQQIVNFTADETSSNEIHFLPYHTLGINKYQLMDLPYHAPKEPLQDNELIKFAIDYAKQKKLTAVLRG